MTRRECQAWHQACGFTTWQQAADALGISVDAAHSYSSGRRDIPPTVDLACRAVFARLEQATMPWDGA